MNQKGAHMFATKIVHCAAARQQQNALLTLRTAFTSLAGLLCLSIAAFASPGADICLESASQSAARHGVPAAVMQAVTTAESGKQQGETVLPWPWTIEAGGTRRWFSDRESAQSYLDQLRASGHDDFFVGCFQLSHLSHVMAFASAGDMIDPARNADFAARFLLELHQRTGSWNEAAQLFRIANPVARTEQPVAELKKPTAVPAASPTPVRAVSAGLGSLVPVVSPWQKVD